MATVLEKNAQQTIADLHPAIISYQLSVIGKQLPTEIDLTTDNWALITACQFTHDRIQQAAYSLISEEQQPVVHRQIGQLLLQNTPSEKREQNIFAIVDQLNVGKQLMIQQSEQNELAELNLIAGKKAKASAAYQAAFNYLKIGLELLDETSWQTQYPLTLALHEEATEAVYLSGHFEQMELWIEVVLQNAKTVLDKVRIYEVKMQAHQARNQLEVALKTGLHVLKLLGIHFPKSPKKIHIVLEQLKIKALIGKHIEKLNQLPEMTKPKQRAIMRILVNMMAPAYMTSLKLFILINLKAISLSLKYGNSPESAAGYSGHGMFLCGYLGEIEAGYQFGKLALNLLHKFNIQKYQTPIKFIVYGFIGPWKYHLKNSLTPLLETYEGGLNIGDLEFAGYAFHNCYFFSSMMGLELSELEPKIQSGSKKFHQLKQETVLNYFKIDHQFLLNLMGTSTNFSKLIGKAYNEQLMVPQHLKANDRTILGFLFYNKLVIGYLSEDYPSVLESAIQAEQYLDSMMGFIYVIIFHFYDSLVRLTLYKTATKQEQRQYRKKIRANQKKMKHWAFHAPMNCLHKYYLVEAEWHHHVLGDDWKAAELYDKAIAGAKENEYLNEEALGYELAAKFYLAKNKHNIARIYFRDAHYTYTQWGALAKVKQLEENYSEFFAITETELNRAITVTRTTKLAGTVTFDVVSFLEASQAIAGETDENLLLKKLMNIVLANAGAQRGVLILDKAGEWFIEAEGAIDTNEITVLQSKPLSQLSIPTKIINYVAHLKESVVLADATQDERFTDDSYFVNSQIKSVVCVPLLKQDQVKGLLYLEHQENNIFSPERVETLKLLSSQIVISLENAQHHTEMANINITYRREIAELKTRIKVLETSLV
ncbi:Serine/Threonine protein kinase and Signal Transduction Histidine Kinase (STHK) with GAF sensor [Beggiatoa sp. PS]|nr:Serine/Threonine protein kinase and Signal Transduction Histidine Kinase (STHK) with GAF sensor [Beggiatoa sp. PS]